MGTLFSEIRQAIRALRNAPGFTAASILTLALGIGANTALFSVLNTVLLRPLPYPHPEQLMAVFAREPGGEETGFSPAEFVDLRRDSRSFTGLAGYRSWPRNLLAGNQVSSVMTTVVTQDFFPVLGQSLALGRFPDSPDEAVISNRLWQTQFGARPDLIGQLVQLDGRSFTITGVFPAGFTLPVGASIWLPSPYAAPPHPLRPGVDISANRDERYFETIGRLKAGVSPEAATGELSTLQARIGQLDGGSGPLAAGVRSLHEDQVGDSRDAILILFGATALLLLIACANLANLALVRFATRERQWLVRAALGASRSRLARSQLVESLLIGVAGGGLGLLVAVWGVSACRAIAPTELRPLIDPSPDFSLLAFALAASIVAGLGIGALPLLNLMKDISMRLREGSAGSGESSRRRRARSLLVVSEVALAFLLAVGAGLLVKAFVRIQQVPLGFSPGQVLTLSITPSRSSYPEPADRAVFIERLRQAIGAVPGAAQVSVVSRLPLNQGNSTRDYVIEGASVRGDSSQDKAADYLVTGPGYFRSLGITVLRGREFSEQDLAQTPPVVIVSARFAEENWPGVNPVGRRLTVGDSTWREVIAVVGDVRQHRLDQPPEPTLYVPYAQAPWPSVTVVIRSKGDPMALSAPVAQAVQTVDRGQAISSVRSMETVLEDSLVARRFSLVLIGIFAGVALALTAVGVYGVIAYTVNQRLREVAIRLALGAMPGSVLSMVLRTGLGLAGVGLTIGVLGALWLAPLLRGMLYAVAPLDAATFLLVALGVLGIAAVATGLPAYRASRVDPMTTLRSE